MNKRTLMMGMALLLTLSLIAQQKTPAFPGAEGYGMYTTGGRGGKVYHVTTTEDNDAEGSLRYALNQKGARTIVFDVSGTIHLTSELKVKNGDVTIAGQTAPGDGICIADYPFVISCDNIIIRYLRFRLGNKFIDFHEGDGLGSMDHDNIIVDHCSVSWSIDECLSVYGGKNITVQWCIASQSLRNSGHAKGAHGYGGNWGGSGASYHHNLLAHHDSRCPRLGPRTSTQTDERVDIRNNVFYNWGGNGCYGGEGQNVNIVSNYYKPGPGTAKRGEKIAMRIAQLGVRTTEYTKHDTDAPNKWDVMWHRWGKYFIDGNINSKYGDVTEDNWYEGVYDQIDPNKCDGTYTEKTRDTIRAREPIPFESVTTHPTSLAYDKVLQYAGASLHRDWVDELMVDDTRKGVASHTGVIKDAKGRNNIPGIIDTQEDNRPADADANWNAWPELKSQPAPVDTDGDGIPDTWEKAHGLNPNDASDGSKTIHNSQLTIHNSNAGYTNLEVYMNSLVEDITNSQNEGGKVLRK